MQEIAERIRAALNGQKENATRESGVSYAASDNITLNDIRRLQRIGKKNIADLSSKELRTLEKWAFRYYKEIGTKSPFFRAWFGDWRIQIVDAIIEDSIHYAIKNKNLKQIKQVLGRIDEIAESAILFDTSITEGGKANKKGSTSIMHYLYAPITVNNAPFLVRLVVEEYDIDNKKEGTMFVE